MTETYVYSFCLCHLSQPNIFSPFFNLFPGCTVSLYLADLSMFDLLCLSRESSKLRGENMGEEHRADV